MNSYADGIDRLEISVVSQDGCITGHLRTESHIYIEFADEDVFYDYTVDELTADLQLIIRSLHLKRKEAIRNLVISSGYALRNNEIDHWDARVRRYRKALAEVVSYGESSCSGVGIGMTSALNDQTVWLKSEFLDDCDEKQFLSAFYYANEAMWSDYRTQSRQLKDQYLKA